MLQEAVDRLEMENAQLQQQQQGHTDLPGLFQNPNVQQSSRVPMHQPPDGQLTNRVLELSDNLGRCSDVA